MKYKEIHIFATDNPEGIEWNHNDWFYELRAENSEGKVVGKLHKRRCHATREANKLSNKVIQWYPI